MSGLWQTAVFTRNRLHVAFYRAHRQQHCSIETRPIAVIVRVAVVLLR
jgi:hypothetical protein